MSEASRAHLFEYFPGNFVWSQSINAMIDMANWGAASMGEIDQVGKRLKNKQGDNEAWFTEWQTMAEDQERKAEAAVAAGHQLTAGTNYLHAATYHLYAERFIPPSERKFDSYRKCMHCFEEGYKRRYPTIERVEVPYENGQSLPALFMRAPGAGPKPTMVCFDGLDLCKEMSILFIGVELANRGYHTLAIDGPGQGEALRLRNIPSRYDYEVPGAAAFDYVAGRADVDKKRIGVMSFSLGGYYTPRMAAFEKRYAAAVAWAREHFPRNTYINGLLEEAGLEPAQFDLITRRVPPQVRGTSTRLTTHLSTCRRSYKQSTTLRALSRVILRSLRSQTQASLRCTRLAR